VQRVIEAVLPGSLVGLTLQHHPISPFIAKWSRPILNGSFNAGPIETYLSKHPRGRRFVRASDVFPKRAAMLRSDSIGNTWRRSSESMPSACSFGNAKGSSPSL